MIEYDNQTTSHYNLALIQKIAASMSKRNIELILTNSDTIRLINAEHRGIDSPTDVLSFPTHANNKRASLGSIVICDDYVIAASSRYAHAPQEEFVLLFIHGLLHLLGFDHETDHGEMRRKEEHLIQKYALPQSLIVRTQEE
jgi:probable rRNA maturation factor